MTSSPPKPAAIDTAKVAARRILKFDSLDQVLAEADRLAAADRAGRLKQLGNWTLGQTFNHLAGWAEYAYTPAPLKPPFLIRWILRLRKHSFLYKPMPAGVKIPGVAGGTLETEAVSLEDGLRRLKAAVTRLKTDRPTAPSPALGPLTHAEAIALNLRHAELHLGFHTAE